MRLQDSQILLGERITSASGSLAAITSPDSWEDRILGKSEVVRTPLALTWVATGNNVALAADTTRRTVHIRLESRVEKPEERTDFKHLNLVKYTRSYRAEYLHAGLTMLAAYHGAGLPAMNLAAWGSFDGWSDLIRGAIVWCGLPDPGITRQELAKRSDVDASALRVLINQWATVDQDGTGLTASSLYNLLEKAESDHDPIREALLELCGCVNRKLPSTRSIGNRFSKIRGRVIDGRALECREDRTSRKVWFVQTVNKPSADFAGSADSTWPRSDEIPADPLWPGCAG